MMHELSASFPMASTRSKLPLASVITSWADRPQLLQRERFRAIAKLGGERPQLLASPNRAADIQRELPFVRPLGLRARQRACERRRCVKIETLRLQFRRYLRAATALPVRDRDAAFYRAAIDFGLHGIDGKSVRRDRDVTAQPEWLLAESRCRRGPAARSSTRRDWTI